MASSAFYKNPQWNWPGHWPGDPNITDESTHAKPDGAKGGPPPTPPSQPKHYGPRTCRICLETVLPTFEPVSSGIPNVFQSQPSVSYVSEDPHSGRLIRPCKCKGSSRYVHERCLQSWRLADPNHGRRNYWDCPTCGFRYRLERIWIGRLVSSTAELYLQLIHKFFCNFLKIMMLRLNFAILQDVFANPTFPALSSALQLLLTLSILLFAMFILGFVADPIINLYLDPYTAVSSIPLTKLRIKSPGPIVLDEEPSTWFEHFLKGLASLGLLSFVKVLWMLGPTGWWNLRSSGLIGGGGGRAPGGSGRDRLASISWIVVIVGVGTFLWGVYKGVRAWSRRILGKVGESVQDVQGDDDDNDKDSASTGDGQKKDR